MQVPTPSAQGSPLPGPAESGTRRPPWSARPPTRRALVGAGAGAACGILLGGCGTAGARGRAASTPTAGSQRTVVVFQPYTDAYGFPSPATLHQLMYELTAPFRDAHPGIDLKLFGTTVNPTASVLAGGGPDVPQLQGGGGGIDGWLTSGLLLDLTPYVQQSNLNLLNFSAGQLATVTYRGGLYGLPNYMGTAATVVNLGVLDDLGLPYPSRTWDYQEYANLAASVAGSVRGAGSASAWRYGTTIDYQSSGPDAFYYHGFGGSIVDPADAGHCTIDSAACVAAGEYLYDMLWKKTAKTGRVDTGSFAAGTEVAPFAWVQQMLQWVSAWRSVKWDFWPMPTWPSGAYTMTNPNYFAITAGTAHPAAAWELVQWLCAGPVWQEAMIKLVLLPPGYLPVWDTWLSTVKQVAPPLAGKTLSVFSAEVHTGHAIQVEGAHFAYQDAQAKQILGTWAAQLLAQKVSVADAYAQAAAQVNLLQAAGKTEASGAAGDAGVARAVVAGLPQELGEIPALFPNGGRQP